MGSQAPFESEADAREREALNAAFRELGLPCELDADAFHALAALPDEARVQRVLETDEPHLLKAYDPSFLVSAICEAKSHAMLRGAPASGYASRAWEFVAGQTGF
jgi:hypothetical protein